MQARFYDPQVGRFLSTDPIHFKDDNPFTFNRYSYANNNPYRFTDPNGKEPFTKLISTVRSGGDALGQSGQSTSGAAVQAIATQAAPAAVALGGALSQVANQTPICGNSSALGLAGNGGVVAGEAAKSPGVSRAGGLASAIATLAAFFREPSVQTGAAVVVEGATNLASSEIQVGVAVGQVALDCGGREVLQAGAEATGGAIAQVVNETVGPAVNEIRNNVNVIDR